MQGFLGDGLAEPDDAGAQVTAAVGAGRDTIVVVGCVNDTGFGGAAVAEQVAVEFDDAGAAGAGDRGRAGNAGGSGIGATRCPPSPPSLARVEIGPDACSVTHLS